MRFAVVVCLTVFGVSGCYQGESTYDRFTHACQERHGFVADVGGVLVNRQCILNNQIVYIPEDAY